MVLSLSCSAVFALFAHYSPVSEDWWMLGAHGGEVSSSQHHIPSQLREEICVIYLVVPKLFIFYFTALLKCYLGFTFKWKLALLSISPVSYSHDSNEVRLSYCVPDKTKCKKILQSARLCCEWLAILSNLVCQMEIELEIRLANEQVLTTDFCQRVATQQEKSYRQKWKSGYKPMVVFQQTETHCDITMHYLYLTTPVWANKFLKTASMNLAPDVITLKTPFCHLVVVSPFMLYLCFCFSKLHLLTMLRDVYCSGRQFFQEGT